MSTRVASKILGQDISTISDFFVLLLMGMIYNELFRVFFFLRNYITKGFVLKTISKILIVALIDVLNLKTKNLLDQIVLKLKLLFR